MANENFILVDSVDEYNKAFGLDTLHPLVLVVDLSKATKTLRRARMHYGVYALFQWPTVSVSNTPSTLPACSRKWWVSHRVSTGSRISVIN